jgi:hypothetical protein
MAIDIRQTSDYSAGLVSAAADPAFQDVDHAARERKGRLAWRITILFWNRRKELRASH